ncbi:MAG: MBL fold metallo-hydrolase [Firmicutes bacterium]|nr:MBL fold metallo-hydrolase [Bacillota bacterium]
MKIKWLTTASILITSNDSTIAFDPFMEMPLDRPIEEPGRPELIDMYRKVDRVYISHGHFDHIYHFQNIYKGTDTPIYGTAAPLISLERDGLDPDNLHLIEPGYKESFGPWEIEAYQGRHCKFDLPIVVKTLLDPRTRANIKRLREIQALMKLYQEDGEMLFYELRAEGKRVQIMGSMGMDPGTDYPTGADLLIMALQGRSDQDSYALRFLETLKPKKIFLYHTDDSFPPMSGDIDTLRFEINAKKAGVTSIKPVKGKEYEI